MRQSAAVENALAITVQGLVAVIVMMQTSVEALESALTDAFQALPASSRIGAMATWSSSIKRAPRNCRITVGFRMLDFPPSMLYK